MSCDKMEALFIADLRGDISPQDRARLHEHMASCGACDKAYSDAKWTEDGLALLDVEVPAGLAEGARKKARSTTRAAGTEKSGLMGRILAFPPVYRYSLAGLAVAAVLILAVVPRGSGDLPANGPAAVPTRVATAVQAQPTANADSRPREICTISTVNGTVEVMLPDSAWAAARQSLGIPAEGRIRTGEGSSAVLAFEGMANLTMKPSSEVVIKRNGLSMKYGSTWIRVTKRDSRFEVKTPQAIMGVLGTAFGVAVTPGSGTMLEVFEGRVGMSAAGGPGNTWPDGIDANGFDGFQAIVEPGGGALVTPESGSPTGFVIPETGSGKTRRDLWLSPLTGLLAELPTSMNESRSDIGTSKPDEVGWTTPMVQVTPDPATGPAAGETTEAHEEPPSPSPEVIGTEGLMGTMDSAIEDE